MRHPWLPAAEAGDELAVLETDVMRFVAILGLCLAAIFSLVNSAALDSGASAGARPAAASAPADAPPADAAPRGQPAEPFASFDAATTSLTRQRAAPVAPQQVLPQSPGTTAQSGSKPQLHRQDVPGPVSFTLEFASAAALQQLLSSKLVVLYANRDDAFLRFDPLTGFGVSAMPASYYQMHAETVPANLRALLAGFGAGGPVEWGVTLSPQMRARLRQLGASPDGGSLVIDRDGSVHLEAVAEP